jgi:hypothetical protein
MLLGDLFSKAEDHFSLAFDNEQDLHPHCHVCPIHNPKKQPIKADAIRCRV